MDGCSCKCGSRSAATDSALLAASMVLKDGSRGRTPMRFGRFDEGGIVTSAPLAKLQ